MKFFLHYLPSFLFPQKQAEKCNITCNYQIDFMNVTDGSIQRFGSIYFIDITVWSRFRLQSWDDMINISGPSIDLLIII